MQTADRVKKVISEHLAADLETVTSDKTFEALGADSLDIVELAMGIEEEFGIEISDDELETITTVGDALRIVEGKVPAEQEA